MFALDQPTIMDNLLTTLIHEDIEENREILCNLRLVFRSEKTREVIDRHFYSVAYKSSKEDEVIEDLVNGELSVDNVELLAKKVHTQMKKIAKNKDWMTALVNKLYKYKSMDFIENNQKYQNMVGGLFQIVLLAKMGLFIEKK